MNNFFVLLLGEIQRMKKYNILAAGFFVSLIWIGVLHFSGLEDVSKIFPLLIFLDATSMAMLLVGVTMFFEKQEGTIKTLLVSPISKVEYIMAKTFANIISNIETLAILYIYARFFKVINISIGGLLAAVILVAFIHSLIGFLLTYYSKDFTDLLMGIMKYAFLFLIPIFLEEVGLIKNQLIKNMLYIIPTKASLTLLKATARGIEFSEVMLSIFYIVGVSILLFFFVFKKFDDFAVKESGV